MHEPPDGRRGLLDRARCVEQAAATAVAQGAALMRQSQLMRRAIRQPSGSHQAQSRAIITPALLCQVVAVLGEAHVTTVVHVTTMAHERGRRVGYRARDGARGPLPQGPPRAPLHELVLEVLEEPREAQIAAHGAHEREHPARPHLMREAIT